MSAHLPVEEAGAWELLLKLVAVAMLVLATLCWDERRFCPAGANPSASDDAPASRGAGWAVAEAAEAFFAVFCYLRQHTCFLDVLGAI
jgi:hypothetical protein